MTAVNEQRWPCESTHRITVSLDGMKPLTVALPQAVLSSRFKGTLIEKDGVVHVAATKAHYDLWPEDVTDEQLRWDEDSLETWTDMASLNVHLKSQFREDSQKNSKSDVVSHIREVICKIFAHGMQNDEVVFKVQVEGSTESADWYIRTHPPVRISPQGAPVLILTALDNRRARQLENQSKLDQSQATEELQQMFGHQKSPDSMLIISLVSEEEAHVFRYILGLNSTKMRPTSWQKENLPQSESTDPWLATFVQPLYRNVGFDDEDRTFNLSPAILGCCHKCKKKIDRLKRCSRCLAVSYCSVECQRAHWPNHKTSCFKA